MKKYKLLALIFSTSALLAVVSGCGAPDSDDKNDCPAGQIRSAQYNNQCVSSNLGGSNSGCGIGQVYTQYGCLPQGNCQPGSGSYNGQCIPGTTSGYPNTGYPNNGGSGYCQNGQVYYNGQCAAYCPPGTVNYNGVCQTQQQGGGGGGFYGCQGSCPMGYTQTMYGCLPQYTCPSCYGYMYGYCVR